MHGLPIVEPLNDLDPHRLLLAEFIHRSANDFAVACAEVDLARRAVTFDDARDRLAIVFERLLALASIQRLLQAPRDAEMNFGRKLCELCHYHAQARFAAQGVFVNVRACDIPIDSGRGRILLMIISELLTNVARHAFGSPGGTVDIELASRDGEICCLVRDDGIGIATGRAMSGLGSAIITALAREAGIQCNLLSCRIGTSVELRMPIEFVIPPEG
ncbi:MAG: ATP-binding protein [Sphingomonas sp. 28-62-20]|nr:MAG: ATP-binding protein [Sphingomonas sp. 28-62-20]